jgi:hypothetical protein
VIELCKIWGFHGGDYEECRLLEYKNPVRTSQDTHYFSATESSQLRLCKIWGFHGGDYEEWRLLWCYAVWGHRWRQYPKYGLKPEYGQTYNLPFVRFKWSEWKSLELYIPVSPHPPLCRWKGHINNFKLCLYTEKADSSPTTSGSKPR